MVSLQSVASTTLNDPVNGFEIDLFEVDKSSLNCVKLDESEDIRRLVFKHLPDVAPKPALVVEEEEEISKRESEEILEAQLNERRKTIEEVRTIQSDLDEMTRKANAAIRFLFLFKKILIKIFN